MIQVYDAPIVPLLTVSRGGSINFQGIIPFRVPTPDSRVMTSIALLWAELGGQTVPFDMTYGGSFSWGLWLATREIDRGGLGLAIPTGNLVGTRVAPGVVPSDISIDGYADDFAGGQDEIYGELTVHFVGVIPNGLRVELKVRYEPVACEICDEEWKEIISQCNPSALAPAPVVGT